ncbi:MAG TPA: Arm DNA-binding domain-containing protein [Casimicrobiaceae bacterium]|nr:Arm DNA-binding domain-containing protein [Casimicrobiaceae bacterium]
MAKEPLSARALDSAKAADDGKPYRLPDGSNLYLYVAPSGKRSWQYRFRWDGKPQTLTLGKYPKLALADAREQRDEQEKKLANNEHPRVARAKKRADTKATFRATSMAWVEHETRQQGWSEKYRKQVDAILLSHLDDLMDLPLSRIEAPIVAPILEKAKRRAPHMHEKAERALRARRELMIWYERVLVAARDGATVREMREAAQ